MTGNARALSCATLAINLAGVGKRRPVRKVWKKESVGELLVVEFRMDAATKFEAVISESFSPSCENLGSFAFLFFFFFSQSLASLANFCNTGFETTFF